MFSAADAQQLSPGGSGDIWPFAGSHQDQTVEVSDARQSRCGKRASSGLGGQGIGYRSPSTV